MAAQKTNVNLLSKDPFSESLLGKILLWALSIGRYIVVFTELVVILSFLSRFKLDRDLTDLNASIDQRLAEVNSYGSLESEVRSLQERLRFVRQTGDQFKPQQVITILASITPPDVKLDQLSIKGDRIQLSATSLSSQSFALFTRGIQQQSSLTNIQLLNISSGDQNDPGIKFELRADVVSSNTQAR
jgi:Tfp pilus assembly protein PilN